MSLRFLFPAVAALLLAPAPAVRGAVAITDTHVTNIGTTTFSVVWMTSEVSTPALEVYSDAAGTIAITSTLGLEYYPIAEGDPRLINTSAARAGQRALEVLAINRRVVVVRVTGLASATTYYVRPRTFDTSGSDNGMGPVPLVAATTAEFSSLVVDARLVRIRFPAFPSEGMVAVLEGPAGSTKLSAIVGDSTDADAVVFPLANIMEAAQRTNALYNAPQPITLRVIGAGAPAGSFTRTIDFGGTFKVAGYQAIDADLASPAPYFTTQPADQSVVVGANATFTVVAAGTPAPAVKWQRKPAGGAWSDLAESAAYSGVQTATLTVAGATLAMTGDQFRAVATNGVPPDATSTNATLTVNVPNVAPTITTQPQPQGVVVGGTSIFRVAASGTPSPTFRWEYKPNGSSTWTALVDGSVFSGTTTATLTITATLALNGAEFRAIVTNGIPPDATSNAVALTVNVATVAPAITTQPQPAAVSAGGNATFTVAASGTPTPAIKWQYKPAGGSTWSDLVDGAVYSGATTPTLIVTAATLAMSGDEFRAVAANGTAPDATSNATALTVSVATVAPSITTAPVPAGVLAGGAATFTVAASGTPTPAVKWQRSAAGNGVWTDLVDGVPYSGASTTTLTITGATLLMSGDQFRAVATNGVLPDATSTAATLTVTVAPVAPSITTAPVPAGVLAGGTATFTVAASGTPTPAVKWQRSAAGNGVWIDLGDGVPYSGASTTTLTITGATLLMSGDQFRAVATNGVLPDATSTAATLTVTVAAVAPSITTHPSSATVATGATASFTVAASGTPTPTIKWQRLPSGSTTWADLPEASPYSGTGTISLTITNTTSTMTGDQFRAIAANGIAPDATSNAATLFVSVAGIPPAIATPPVNVTAMAGANAVFTVAVSGTPVPTIKWQRQAAGAAGWIDLAASAVYSGVNTTTLTVVGATASMTLDQFRVVATNGVPPDATSTAAVLLVIPITPPATAPTITSQPASATVMEGASASFAVQAMGSFPLSYQWFKDGAPIAGATSSTLGLARVQLTDAGGYVVNVSNTAGTVSSNAAVLTVAPKPPTTGAPTIVVQPASATFRPGDSVSLTVSALGTLPLTYQWFKDGRAIPGASGARFSITNASISATGAYRVVVSNSAGSLTSAIAMLKPRFAGTFFGNFGGNRGQFAFYLRGDGFGVFLGYAPSAGGALTSRSVVVDENGNYRAVIRIGASGPTASVTASPPRANANAEYTLSGSISESGTVTGAVSGLDLTFSASVSPAAGSTTAVAGFYQAGAAGSSATSYTIVGTGGEAFVVTTSGATADAGQGTVTASGELSVTTDKNAQVTGTVQAATSTISATITSAGGTPVTFVGGSDSRGLVEKLVNVSTRTQAGADSNTLIAGFVITGTDPKPVLIRAIGPSLSQFGVSDVLGAVRLEIYRDQTHVGSGGDWGRAENAAAIAAAATRVGAFQLPTNSRDAALLLSLVPGAYTAQVTGESGRTGVALVEVYDATEGNIPPGQRIVNVSTRALAGTGDATLIAGFVINGSVPKRVLFRGAGPALARFGVTGNLARPQLTIYSDRTAIARNAGWSTSPDAAAIAEATDQVGAFSFAAGSSDSAVILNLAPGAYTVQVTGGNDTSGVALIEVYEIP